MTFLVSVKGEKLQTPDVENYQVGSAVNRPLVEKAALVSRGPTILVPRGAADHLPTWKKVNERPIDEQQVLTYRAPWTKHQEHADVVIVGADPTDPTSTPGIFMGGEGIYAEELRETALRWVEKRKKGRAEREAKFKDRWFNPSDGLLVRLHDALERRMTKHKRNHRTDPARNDLPAEYYTGKRAI